MVMRLKRLWCKWLGHVQVICHEDGNGWIKQCSRCGEYEMHKYPAMDKMCREMYPAAGLKGRTFDIGGSQGRGRQ